MPQDVKNPNENVANPIAGELEFLKQKLRNTPKYCKCHNMNHIISAHGTHY